MPMVTPSNGTVEVRILGAEDAHLLDNVADGVFDDAVHPAWWAEFLADPRHHLAVALDGDRVIGMASGVHYLHPDKPHQLFINEAGVSDAYQSRGIGRRLLRALLDRATALGCESAWVLTESENTAARRMYAAAGGVESPNAPIMIEFRT